MRYIDDETREMILIALAYDEYGTDASVTALIKLLITEEFTPAEMLAMLKFSLSGYRELVESRKGDYLAILQAACNNLAKELRSADEVYQLADFILKLFSSPALNALLKSCYSEIKLHLRASFLIGVQRSFGQLGAHQNPIRSELIDMILEIYESIQDDDESIHYVIATAADVYLEVLYIHPPQAQSRILAKGLKQCLLARRDIRTGIKLTKLIEKAGLSREEIELLITDIPVRGEVWKNINTSLKRAVKKL